MRAVWQWRPERFDRKADAHFVKLAMHDIGQYIDANVERDGGDEERLMALERLARASGDCVGEDLAFARDFAPFEVGPPGEETGCAREELILAALAAVLNDQLDRKSVV